MNTHRSSAHRSTTQPTTFEGSRRAGNQEAHSVSPSEVLAILEPTPDEPESIRTMYLWKTGQPTAQPVAA